ncbi:PREDICTED: uncharacterized protein LOC106111532 [Papilio polytes]|uniref:uncharacterized protein LOC106111532 n=1 Tax=Papilio polytes TaxID=76194 RepID=UPI000675EC8E|nr:PREDICTED: uncharacterized protein LOC106111532 [Papilio polytes]
MASSDPELRDGITLPVWMKTKPVKEFEPFAASPPAPEDSFFYIRYPKTDVLFGKPKVGDIPKLMNEQQKDQAVKAAYNTIKEQDWSKHTKPCQDVLHGIAPINKPVDSKPTSAGTEDGFKGEGAACGNSVVKVAHQMIQSNRSPRGFTVASPTEEEAAQYMCGFRYFTSPFEPVEDASGRSWLTMALLGFKKDLTTSTSTLAEEDAIETRLQGGTLAESVENLGPAPRVKESMMSSDSTQQPQLRKPAPAFTPKPSELREMNFWSPTSM